MRTDEDTTQQPFEKARRDNGDANCNRGPAEREDDIDERVLPLKPISEGLSKTFHEFFILPKRRRISAGV